MEDGIKKLVSLSLTVPLALSYCYLISSRISVGLPRLISLFPIIFLFITLPPHLPSVSFIATSTFFLTWLASFKLILFAFGRGPLSSEPSSKSLTIFMASAALPIQTNISNNSKNNRAKQPFLDYMAAKILLSAILFAVFINYGENLHHIVSSAVFTSLIYLVVDSFVAFSNSFIGALMKLNLEQPFDEPYYSTSLQEFWGRRWNLPVTSILRETVYKPVRSASAAVVGSDLAPAFAILAVFLVSGLMHELLLYYATATKPSWDMTLFFVLHGICVVLEFGVKKGLNGRLGELPVFVSALATVGFVWMTSVCLFFPAFVGSGYGALVLEEIDSLRKNIHLGKTLLFRYWSVSQ